MDPGMKNDDSDESGWVDWEGTTACSTSSVQPLVTSHYVE